MRAILHDMDLPFDTLATELIQALRGKRTQAALSRRLGFKTNVVYTWEAGRRWPTAAETLRLARSTGVDVTAAVEGFFREPPRFCRRVDVASREGIAELLGELRGSIPVVDLAARAGKSRFAISRYLSGEAEPKLPDFLRLVEASSMRVLDFLARFVDPKRLPAAREPWRRLAVRRRAISDEPFLPAVMLALETVAVQSVPFSPGAIADRLGIDRDTERRCLEILVASGQVRKEGTRYVIEPIETVDTRPDPDAERRLKAHYARVGVAHIERAAEGLFSFNVLTVSRRDLERLRELHRSYFRQLRALVAGSTPQECVVVANVQLFELTRGG